MKHVLDQDLRMDLKGGMSCLCPKARGAVKPSRARTVSCDICAPKVSHAHGDRPPF